MTGTTAAARVLEQRRKNRRLPTMEGVNVQDAELARAIQNVQEHFRMYEGDSGAPKERFVTLAELENAGVIKSDVKSGFAYISQVLQKDVAQQAGSTANPTLKDPVKRDTSRQSRTAGGGGGQGGGAKAQASTATTQKLNDSKDVAVAKPAKNEFLYYDGNKFTNFPLFRRDNKWQGQQIFVRPITLLERAEGPAALDDRGYLWLKSGSPNTLWFTDSAGTEFQIPAGSSSIPAGTTNNSVLKWNGANWVEDTDVLLAGNYARFNEEIWGNQAISVQGPVSDVGQIGQFGFIDINTGVARFGSYDYDTAAWQPVAFRGSETEIVATSGDITLTPVSSGFVQATRLRLSSTDDLGLASTLHAFQVGNTAGLNMAMDNNELQARNNGAAGTLNLQTDGGVVDFGITTAATVNVRSGGAFRVYDSTNTDYFQISESGSNSQFSTNNNSLQISTGGGVVELTSGQDFRIRDASNSDWVSFAHDGTNLNTTFVNTSEWIIALPISVTGANSSAFQAGINGNYSSTGASTQWGATIWAIDTTWDGGTAGNNSVVTSVYGLRWHRGSHANASGFIGEGLYVYNNGNLQAGMGTVGIWTDGGIRASEFLSITDSTQPWLTLDSTSSGDNWTAQGAGVSVGESGKKGDAAIHMTYNGNGSGYIGMGSVDDTASTGGRPTYGHIDFTYNNRNVLIGGLLYPGNSAGTTGGSLVQGVSYIESCDSQHYGSINVAGASGSLGTYSGYSINRRVVFMNNNSTTSGIYNDTNNEWYMTMVENSNITLYFNGIDSIRTQAYNSTGQTSGAEVIDHGDTYRDVGFNVLPTFNFNASDTLEASHCGHSTGKTNTTAYTLTGPTSSDVDFPVGGVCTIMNLGSSTNYTISDTATCTMYVLDGSSVTDIAGSATVAPGGIVTLYRYSTTAIYLWGSGLTA